jgi:hypothetical protein
MGIESPGVHPADRGDEGPRESAVARWKAFGDEHDLPFTTGLQLQARMAAETAAEPAIQELPRVALARDRAFSAVPGFPSRGLPERTRTPPMPWEAKAGELAEALSPIRAGDVGDTPAARLERTARIARDLWRSVAAELTGDQPAGSPEAELHLLAEFTQGLLGDLEKFGQAELSRAKRQHRSQPDTKTPRKPFGAPKRGAAFDLHDPDGNLVAQITPKPVPVKLQVASPSHGEVSFPALARYFPKHTVHARDCTAIVEGSNCELLQEDHYHVQHISVSLQPLLEPGSPARAALLALSSDPSDAEIARFQQAVQKCLDEPAKDRETQASVTLRKDPQVRLSGVAAVHQGNETRTSIKTRYVAEDSQLPVTELLATNKDLVRSLAAAKAEAGEGPAAYAFLHDALKTAGCTADADLLDHATGLHDPATAIRGLFGTAQVTHASAAMAGVGNTLNTSMQIHRGELDRATVMADLSDIRALASPGADATPRPEIPTGQRDGKAALSPETISSALRFPASEADPGLPYEPEAGL